MPASTPRRQPTGDDRIRDAERTRNRLLDAALDEFAARGFAGARVSAIAERAGVNKQLISYYFGGKQGLYRALRQRWEQAEREVRRSASGTTAIALAYLHRGLRDPRGTRMAMWQALAAGSPDDGPAADEDRTAVAAEQAELRAHQAAGDLDPDLDLAAVQLAITGMVVAPVVLPDLVAALFDEPVDSAAFEARYSATLTTIIDRLRPTSAGPSLPTEDNP